MKISGKPGRIVSLVVGAALCISAQCRGADESPLVLFTAMTGRPGAKEAAEYFDSAQRAGFSQMMLYPRSGLEWDYMGEEWLSFVGDCLKEAKSRGPSWRSSGLRGSSGIQVKGLKPKRRWM